MDPCGLIESVRDIAREAGARIMPFFREPLQVEHKQDGTPITAADRAAHDVIVGGLCDLTPGIPLISEESSIPDYARRCDWPRLWLIDPLDGTREFAGGREEFTVNIALIERGRPVLGVVYAPVSGRCYYRCGAGGSFVAEPHHPPRQIRVASYSGGRARVVASRSHAGERVAKFLGALARREGDPAVLSIGSALKICLVAEGAADVYPRLGPTSEWDTAAAQCVVEGAGGRVMDMDGNALSYNKPSLINPEFIVFGGGEYPWLDLVES